MKEEKVIRTFECTIADFLTIYKDEDGQRQYHLARGDINISFTPWTTTTTTTTTIPRGSETRSISFQAPINAPPSIRKLIGKDATSIVEQQYIMGDYFNVETEWILSKQTNNQIKLELTLRTTFNMYMVGHLFEVFIIKAAAASATQYVDIVQERIDAIKIERLKMLQAQLIQHQQNEQELARQQQQQQQQLATQSQSQTIKQYRYPLEHHPTQHRGHVHHSDPPPTRRRRKSNNSTSASGNSSSRRDKNVHKFKNWSVDCKTEEIEDYLKHDLEDLRDYTQHTTQSLLKIEISLSEMMTNNLQQTTSSNNNSGHNNISNNSGYSNIYASDSQPSSIMSSPCSSTSSLHSSTNGATEQQLSNVENLLHQMELNSRLMRERRQQAEHAIDQELSAIMNTLSMQNNNESSSSSNKDKDIDSKSSTTPSSTSSTSSSAWYDIFFPVASSLVVCMVVVISIFALSKPARSGQQRLHK
ncbi:hypothetical protein SAMD00019534_026630 [Acytostelium subglobosum LB1]|uniref:hypothetical protein n=1 Tax=Acytostelium subglobosum LB1 TaxID=1410327 RepID=UPI000644D56E|nr:hypothetical protein SAMD00019534_026630 [Acytostelium subglobosum LB1]GAM19488.1 hypothetical protein SAMD00019534_026630 [Acytostelium subglobosum LB1]|eukprot:XP_012757415.1 hypothetical protein SAMD00019534_026630 [Acytostelium subglobosum LB1]